MKKPIATTGVIILALVVAFLIGRQNSNSTQEARTEYVSQGESESQQGVRSGRASEPKPISITYQVKEVTLGEQSPQPNTKPTSK